MLRNVAAVRLGVDFGTSHTVAVLSRPDGRAEALLFDASPLLPSAIFAPASGPLLTGRDAERSARLDPAAFEPHPKRRIDDTGLLLGERDLPVVELVAATLRRVGDEATRALGGNPPHSTVLTHPAAWGGPRRALLAEAAVRAGLPAPAFVPEPVAAAMYFTTVLGHPVADGHAIVVYDFGGGTFDISVLRRAGAAWQVAASQGLDDVGGVDLDAAIVGWIGQQVSPADPALWARLDRPATAADRRLRRSLWDDARALKELLSRGSSGGVAVPLFDRDLILTRAEFEALARPWIDRTVALTTSTLFNSRVTADRLAGVFLVGGASRVPLVATLLHRGLGVAPVVLEQPELVVALGSLLVPPGLVEVQMPALVPPVLAPLPPAFAAPAEPTVAFAAPPISAPPISAPPVSAPPVSAPPVAPPSAAPAGLPVSAPPVSAPPVSAAPAGLPVSAPPVALPVSAPPASAPPPVAGAPAGEPPAAAQPSDLRRKSGEPDLRRKTAEPDLQRKNGEPDLRRKREEPVVRRKFGGLAIALAAFAACGLIGLLVNDNSYYTPMRSAIFAPLAPKPLIALLALAALVAATPRTVPAFRALVPAMFVTGGALLSLFVAFLLIEGKAPVTLADGLRLVESNAYYDETGGWIFTILAVLLLPLGAGLLLRRSPADPLAVPEAKGRRRVWAALWATGGFLFIFATGTPLIFAQHGFGADDEPSDISPAAGLDYNNAPLSWWAVFALGTLLVVGAWLLAAAALGRLLNRAPWARYAGGAVIIAAGLTELTFASWERDYWAQNSSTAYQLVWHYWQPFIYSQGPGLPRFFLILTIGVAVGVATVSLARSRKSSTVP